MGLRAPRRPRGASGGGRAAEGGRGHGGAAHLQDEDEVVGRLVARVQVMTGAVLAMLVKPELLDDVWVLEQSQQDLL